jgi:haloalkane dehalogenase
MHQSCRLIGQKHCSLDTTGDIDMAADGAARQDGRPSWVDDELLPFQSHFAEVDGHTIHYIDEGSGPILLMLHGNPTWSFVYRQVITQLRDSFRCVALDYPGFGLSTAASCYGFHPDEHARVVAGFVERLDLRDVTVVMQDWGGPIGLSAALIAPERYSSLVIGNTWAWPVNGDPHFEVFSRVMGGPLVRVLIRQFNFFVNAMLPAGHRRRKLPKAEMDHYRLPLATPARRNPTGVFPRDITGSREFLADLERGVISVLSDLPALLVWADADVAFRMRELHRWQSIMRRQHTTVLPGAGHYLQSDAPTDFAQAIRDWWAQR